MKIYTFIVFRHYNSFSKENLFKKIICTPVGRTLAISGIGFLFVSFFPIIISGFLVLMTTALLSLFFQPFFNTQYLKRNLNSTRILERMNKYEKALSFLFKPFISSIIPDTNSLAQKLYTDSIKRIQYAIKMNELDILYILGTEKALYDDYHSFSMININGLSNFSITFNVCDFYNKNSIASAIAYGTMDKYNVSSILKKISITNENGEKVVLYNNLDFNKNQGKTIDAEYWTTKSIN
ncbi:hypothetical protein PORY_001820 [Pneumocystis oryctolagi]|uniref:Uncharacterized protein n=1 Tax=Pneumocystis oryctolagi TaxID=42067 RepID=A0ACB7CE50_9ASCO|nr:hypothetical protein PORY_001820 [Pneumocystis oryctolagi]